MSEKPVKRKYGCILPMDKVIAKRKQTLKRKAGKHV